MECSNNLAATVTGGAMEKGAVMASAGSLGLCKGNGVLHRHSLDVLVCASASAFMTETTLPISDVPQGVY